MLSIIVPTYNSINTVRKCINSLVSLRRIKYEIILVDDGSTDGTGKINDNYAEKYNNIKSLHQIHGGVSKARNYALTYAKGSWINFVDSDDYINARNLEKIYNLYANHNVDLIISNVNRNGNSIGLNNKSVRKSNISAFLHNNYPIYGKFNIMDNSGKIYKANILNKYKIRFPIGVTISEDSIFTLRYLMHVKKNILQTHIVYYNYYVNSGSSVENYDRNRINNVKATFKALKDIYYHYHLSFTGINWIKIRLSYSILLNALRVSKNKVQMISKAKDQIYQLRLIPNRRYKYRKLECNILQYIIEQPFIYILFIFLRLLHMRHNVRVLHKL